MMSFMPFLFLRRRIIPIIEPAIEPINIVMRLPCQPRNEPIIAMSLISPPPMPPLFIKAMRKKMPPPIKRPRSEFTNEIVKKLNNKPTTIPGRVILSGIILFSRSMNAIITKAVQRRIKTKNPKDKPNFMYRAI